MMAPDVASVSPLEPYVVRVFFDDGEVRDVDIEPLLGGPVFGLFAIVRSSSAYGWTSRHGPLPGRAALISIPT